MPTSGFMQVLDKPGDTIRFSPKVPTTGPAQAHHQVPPSEMPYYGYGPCHGCQCPCCPCRGGYRAPYYPPQPRVWADAGAVAPQGGNRLEVWN